MIEHLTSHRYKEGLLSLNGLLSLRDSSEAELHSVFGQDSGVAFLLLGKIKYKLQHKEEAASCFRFALRQNPFLWSAFVSLCEIEGGEVGSVGEYFKVSEYPAFLRPHPLSPPISTQAFATQSKSVGISSQGKAVVSDAATEQKQDDVNLICAESASLHLPTRILNNAQHHTSAFKPVAMPIPKNMSAYMTPDIFNVPSMGQAIASSTPTPAAPKSLSVRDRLLPYTGVWSEGAAREKEGLEWSQPPMGTVKAALDFGSTSSKCSRRGTSSGVTPLHPRCVLVFLLLLLCFVVVYCCCGGGFMWWCD